MTQFGEALDQLTRATRREETLSLQTRLPAPPDTVWTAIIDPARTTKWSPIVPDRVLDSIGPATTRENPGDDPVDCTVLECVPGFRLAHRWGSDTVSWQVAPDADGTVLLLVQELADPVQAADMAAGWHICLTMLGLQLQGADVPRCVGADAVTAGWESLRDRYQDVFVAADPDQGCGSGG